MAAEKVVEKSKNEEIIVIDGSDLILGRLGSFVAKKLLLGARVKIVNCKNVVIQGRKKYLVEKYKAKLQNRVVKQGPYYSRSPADLVRRSMRNMLPYKSKRGAEAFKRLECYNNVPESLKSSKFEIVENAKVDEDTLFYFMRMGDLAKILGYNKMI